MSFDSSRIFFTVAGAVLILATSSWAMSFEIEDTGASLVVRERGAPVLEFKYAPVAPPPAAKDKTARSCYIHPLYGLDGDILTEDWPEDHFHHRGVFWAWPWCQVKGRRMDLWLSQDAHQVFEKVIEQETSEHEAIFTVQNAWRFDDTLDETPVRETVTVVVKSSDTVGRAIDFNIRIDNLTEEVVIIQGQRDASKGYGGFCVRPDAKRSPLEFTSLNGRQQEDTFELASPWVDVSSRITPDGDYSGVALFQHPENEGFPHKGWLIRHYGFLGASWPHTSTYELLPGKSLTLRYRLFVHRGDAEKAQVAERFKEFEASVKQ